MHLLSRLSAHGVHDEKMLEKLATHQVETVTTLFALTDKCTRAAEGRTWHSAPQGGPTQPSNWGDPILPGLRGRSMPSSGDHYGLATSPNFR
jgi:hypothetical protein